MDAFGSHKSHPSVQVWNNNKFVCYKNIQFCWNKYKIWNQWRSAQKNQLKGHISVADNESLLNIGRRFNGNLIETND